MMLTATTGDSVGEAVNILCQKLGVGIPRETERGEIERLLAACAPHQAALLDWLDRETIPVAAMSMNEAKGLWR